MGSGVEVRSESIGRATVLSPLGDIDLGGAPDFRVSLRAGIEAASGPVVVDLASVQYMDSSGVATLVDAMRLAKQRDVPLTLCGLAPRVRSIFEIARLDRIFAIVETRDDALGGADG